MSTSDAALAVTVYRGPAIENTHLAHVAVVDVSGRLVLAFGDPHRPTLPRSAVKPAQALAAIETGALERFGFDDADLALMCASHSSEDVHIERVRAMLAKSQASETDLRCGGHPPLSEEVHRAWIKRDFTPTAVCSNCSGKHAGMLAAARAMGAGIAGYEDPNHPLQRHVRRVIGELCELPDEAIAWGIDGCNLPTPAFALDRLARVFAKLADAADIAENATAHAATRASTPRAAALARIYRAMTTYPELVAGQGRFCTTLMRAFDGAVVGKVGADGSYALGVRPSAHRVDGVNGPLGVAVKVENGNGAILTAIVVALIDQLGIGTAEQRARLEVFRAPPIKNTVGIEVGHLAFSIALAPQTP